MAFTFFILEAIKNNNLDELKSLITKPFFKINKKDDNGWTVMHYSMFYNNPEALYILYQNGADIDITNINDITPLMFACRNEHWKLIKKLIYLGADPNKVNIHGYNAFDFVPEGEKDKLKNIYKLFTNLKQIQLNI